MDLDVDESLEDERTFRSEVYEEGVVVAYRLRRGLVHLRILEDHSAPGTPSQLSAFKIASERSKYRYSCHSGKVLR